MVCGGARAARGAARPLPSPQGPFGSCALPSMARTFTGPSAEEKITASIIALMEKGVSPWRQPWVSGASCHVNLVSGHRYRGANPLLLQIGQLARDAELPFWCGVGEARRFGLFPCKGSKAAYVYRPAPRTKEVLWPDGSVSKDAHERGPQDMPRKESARRHSLPAKGVGGCGPRGIDQTQPVGTKTT